MFVSSDEFLRIARPQEKAVVRLLCFPAAGADAFIWDTYTAFLPETVELCAIQLPNRGQEAEVTSYKQFDEVIQAISTSIVDNARPGQQLVYVGYCIGALWGYAVACHLQKTASLQPAHFIVSGCRAPHLRSHTTDFMRTQKFIEIMTTYYPPHTPPHQYVLSRVPSMIHDADLLDQYMPAQEAAFDCPITILGAQKDQFVPNTQDFWTWQSYTRGKFQVQMFEGDHFFGVSDPELLMRVIVKQLQAEAIPV